MAKIGSAHQNKATTGDLDGSNLESLSAQELAIQERIKKLQDFVEHGPEIERAAEEDRLSTIPAPSEVKEREREKQFMEKLSRGELRNERRHQAKSGLLLFLLILSIFFMALWIYKAVTSTTACISNVPNPHSET